MKRNNCKKQQGVTLLELMLALTLGAVVIAAAVGAAGNFFIKDQLSRANLEQQNSLNHIKLVLGSALRQSFSSVCDNGVIGLEDGRLGMIEYPVGAGGTIPSLGINSNSDIYLFYAGATTGDSYINQVAMSQTDPTPVPISASRPSNVIDWVAGDAGTGILDGTDYFITTEFGPRARITSRTEKAAVETLIFTQINSLASGQWSATQFDDQVFMMSDCQYTTLFQAPSGSVVNNGINHTMTLPGRTDIDFNMDGYYIMPVRYYMYYIGQDSSGGRGLYRVRLDSVRGATNQPQILSNQVADMQILWQAVSPGSAPNWTPVSRSYRATGNVNPITALTPTPTQINDNFQFLRDEMHKIYAAGVVLRLEDGSTYVENFSLRNGYDQH